MGEPREGERGLGVVSAAGELVLVDAETGQPIACVISMSTESAVNDRTRITATFMAHKVRED